MLEILPQRLFVELGEKLRLGGLFVSDNMLWGGSVLGKSRKADVKGVKELTRLLVEARDFATTILPVRDGSRSPERSTPTDARAPRPMSTRRESRVTGARRDRSRISCGGRSPPAGGAASS